MSSSIKAAVPGQFRNGTFERYDAALLLSGPPLTWNPVVAGLGAGVPTNLTAVTVDTDGNGVWVVGLSDNYIVRSTDNGETWTQLPRDLGDGDTGFYMTAVKCNRLTGTWIISGHQKTFRSTDNGANWTKLTPAGLNSGSATFAPTDQNAIAVDSNGVWMIGGPSGYSVKSVDDGATWAAMTASAQSGYSGTWNCINTDGAGTWIMAGSNADGAISVDNGVTWVATQSNLGNNAFTSWRSLEYKTGGIWVALGYYSADNKISVSSDNGQSWSSVNDARWTDAYSVDMRYDPTNDVWLIVGLNGECFYSEDDGATWTEVGDLYLGLANDSNHQIKAVATDEAGTWIACSESGQVTIGTP